MAKTIYSSKKISKIKNLLRKKVGKIILVASSLFLIPVALFAFYNLLFLGKIFPGIYVAGIDARGYDPKAFASHLTQNIKAPEEMVLTGEGKTFKLDPKSFDFAYDFAASAQRAYVLDRSGNIFLDFLLRLKSPLRHKEMGLAISLDESKLENELIGISDQVSVDAIPPSIKLVKNKVVVDSGKEGKIVDISLLRSRVGQNLAYAKSDSIEIPIKTTNGVLSDSEVQNAQNRALKLVGKSLVLGFEFQIYTYKGNDLFAFIDPKQGYNDEAISNEISQLESLTNRTPKNPVFNFASGKVQEFQPAQDGIVVKTDDLKQQIYSGLRALEESDQTSVSFDIPATRTPPEVKTADVNNLGIKQLIGRGTSHFRGSIPSRIHNIILAASKLNGVLVKPDDAFSFNDAIGDVSVFTGYQQAYIISGGKTILGDGGGVCQVSSTLFRAMLSAGLPVIERRAHAYRVGYYEQDSLPGFDATVYSPSPDLKFKNNTPGYILIQTHVDKKKSLLVFELYGTSDGRVATTTKPAVTDQVAPPPDLYQDDPTLPAGTIKQTDFRAWGAKVTFTYTVTRGPDTIYQKIFVSNYQPWQAIYLRGTGPAQ